MVKHDGNRVRVVDLRPLEAFGAEAERLGFPCIDVGGFIVPGNVPVHLFSSGKEQHANDSARQPAVGFAARQEAGSATRSRQGSSEAAATGATAHSVRPGLELPEYLRLEELDYFHPEAELVSSSSSAAIIEIPVGLFRDLPYRARLTFEIPLITCQRLGHDPLLELRSSLLPHLAMPNATPDVRAWAKWEGGCLAGRTITSHHEYPDRCICACSEGEWLLGVHPFVDYVSYCISWIGKALHQREFGFWPGPQHCGPLARARRNRPNEYCGCGKELRYRDCCMIADEAKTLHQRWSDEYGARAHYLSELKWQKRSLHAPRL